METTTAAIIDQATRKMALIASQDLAAMAIPARNDLLDEYRRAEETIDALAETRKEARGW